MDLGSDRFDVLDSHDVLVDVVTHQISPSALHTDRRLLVTRKSQTKSQETVDLTLYY